MYVCLSVSQSQKLIQLASYGEGAHKGQICIAAVIAATHSQLLLRDFSDRYFRNNVRECMFDLVFEFPTLQKRLTAQEFLRAQCLTVLLMDGCNACNVRTSRTYVCVDSR